VTVDPSPSSVSLCDTMSRKLSGVRMVIGVTRWMCTRMAPFTSLSSSSSCHISIHANSATIITIIIIIILTRHVSVG